MTRSVKYQRVCGVAAIALALAGAAACGDSDSGDSGSPYGATSAPTESESPTGDDATAAGAASLAIGTDEELGEFLVDNDGMTLYLFTTDTAGTSTCYDDCAAAWPPLLTDTPDVTASGAVDPELIGTVDRDDGTVQVTYNGQPLYYYVDDDEAGETDGQGLNGVWYVVNPDGTANKKSE
jgi:predicted lipoprotein with Yx(FWY)xxD motif